MDLEKLVQALREMQASISHIRLPPTKKTLQPLQKGMILSTVALPMLLDYMKEDYKGISYILTRRINQDPLESFFGVFRFRSGSLHDNPIPMEFICRLQKSMFGK